MIPKIEECILMAFQSVRYKINKNERKNCFEVFGFDFIIDGLMNVWLIEVNTNPCIEESSPLLAMLIPRMLDDALKICVDS
jgi:D-alanine-D-alanine ligase-like ATP-grasp enzyme